MPPPNILPPTLLFLLLIMIIPHSTTSLPLPLQFREAPAFRNGKDCPSPTNPQDSSTIHISLTLDHTSPYLRGSIAAILSVLQHATCPENTFFHFLTTTHSTPYTSLHSTILSTFPYLHFHLYTFNPNIVNPLISSSIRSALDQPLNYARIYLANLLPPHIHRIIYLDSDLIVVDDIFKLWQINLNNHLIGAPEYCQANFSMYFTNNFWSTHWSTVWSTHRSTHRSIELLPVRSPEWSTVRSTLGKKSKFRACYFNTGVMVLDLEKWRAGDYTKKVEYWMRVQKRHRIYELGSLPPFLLVFAGDVEGVEHRWNQHGLGGDNLEGLCRDLHPGPVSLLHWSGKGKPWLRLDDKKPCPLDSLWAPYDLFKHESLFSDS